MNAFIIYIPIMRSIMYAREKIVTTICLHLKHFQLYQYATILILHYFILLKY